MISRLRAAAILSACGLMVGACGSSVTYDPPENLCSIDVGDLHEPLFPADREARTVWSFDQEKEIHSVARCVIVIGGETLIFSGSTIDTTVSRDLANYDHYRDRPAGEPQVVRGSGFEAEVWPGFALAEVPCHADRDDVALFVGIVANYPEDPEENQAALAELIVPYADGVFAQVEVCDLSAGYRAEGDR